MPVGVFGHIVKKENDVDATQSRQDAANASDSGHERDELMSQLADQITFAGKRIQTLLVAEDPDEDLLIRWVRTQGYLAGQYRKLMRDTDLDEMQEDLDLLKTIKDL